MQPVMIDVIGAEKLSVPGAKPLWFKTRVVRDGHFLKAVTYMVVDGRPKVFNVRVDMRPIAQAVAKRAIAAGVSTSADDVMVGAAEYTDAHVGAFNPIRRKDTSSGS